MAGILSGQSTGKRPGQGTIWGCAWSPNGERVISASSDSTLRIWDAQSGCCLKQLVHLPNGEFAGVHLASKDIYEASPNAWRWLGWSIYHGPSKRLRRFPAEHFGPLPNQS